MSITDGKSIQAITVLLVEELPAVRDLEEALRLAIGHVLVPRPGARRPQERDQSSRVASAGLMERLGMRREAHFRENELVKGAWSDELVYAMLASEWSAR